MAESELVVDLGLSIALRPLRVVSTISTAIIAQPDALNTMLKAMTIYLKHSHLTSSMWILSWLSYELTWAQTLLL